MKQVGNDISQQQQHIRDLLEEVFDPEVPVLSVVDLGIIRNIEITGEDPVITITPTYSGCPAMDVISMNIRMKMMEHGYKNVQLKTILSPAWTTDWMTEKGKLQLKAYGVSPPNPSHSVCTPGIFQQEESIQCPRCNSYNSRLISQFGSTACKALYQCNDCKEPFDYFKCH